MGASNHDPQNIEELRERYEILKTKKITAQANLETSNQTLEDLKKEAREKYGTDNLASLRTKLEEMKKENERKRADYQLHLTEIEAKLAEIESQHAEAARKESQE